VFTDIAWAGAAIPPSLSQLILTLTYARLQWTGTGLTLGTLGGATAPVTFTSGQTGDGPYFMMTFQDIGDVLGATAGDQMLMLEFQTSTIDNSSNMVLDPAATLFNIYDNTAGTYFLGVQQNAQTLSYWLQQYPALTGDTIDGLRIGIGLAGGGCTANCGESLTVYALDVNAGSKATPEPATLPWVGSAFLLAGFFGKKFIKVR
jgi:hypothetical protein